MRALEMAKFIDKSYTNYHCVLEASKLLEKANFEKIDLSAKWNLELGKKYYLTKGESSILAFTVGKNFDIEKGVRIFAGHTDSPTFRIKPNPEVKFANTIRLNVEVYGGPIINTWYDRPLSLAGRVYTKGENKFKPKLHLVNIDKDLVIIPNLAIHQNRTVNSGHKVDIQKHTLPLISALSEELEKENFLIELLAKHLNISKEDILDFDMYLYVREKSSFIGANSEMLSAPRLDNQASMYAGVTAITESMNDETLNIFMGFDNEEIGSGTKQGADSNYLSNVIERIFNNLGYTRDDFMRVLNNSFIISSDCGHAVHPAYVEKSDITNIGMLNEGVLIKLSAIQKYTTDGESTAILKSLCEGQNIKLQYFVNNSNELGGSTIGPISIKHLDIRSIDIGIPLLSMHSAKELCGVRDVEDLVNIAKQLYKG